MRRSGNVLGVIAICIAVGGTALAAQAAHDGSGKAEAAKKKKRGPRGPKGPAGPPGATGATGPAGPNQVTLVRTTLHPAMDDSDAGYAICPGGQRATGGGVGFDGGAGDVGDLIQDNGPTDSSGEFHFTETGDIPDRWYGAVFNAGSAQDAFVWAVCQ